MNASHAIHVTLLFAGLFALMTCLLTALVILRRVQTGVDLLDGGHPGLLRSIRAHANFAEAVPLALLLMALLELSGVPSHWLMALGSALLLGRVMHAAALLSNTQKWARRGGMVLTLMVLSAEGAACLWLF